MSQIIEFFSAYKQLQPHEKVFVDEYVSNLEKEAVKTNTKLKTVMNNSVLNVVDDQVKHFLSLSLVRAAIAERVNDLTEEMELSVYKTLKELRSLAYSNIGNYMKVDENDGSPMFDLSKCTPEELAAVKSIKVDENLLSGKRKFEFVLHDKVSSLDKVMRYQGLLDEEHWKNDLAKQNENTQITHDESEQDASEMYANLIAN